MKNNLHRIVFDMFAESLARSCTGRYPTRGCWYICAGLPTVHGGTYPLTYPTRSTDEQQLEINTHKLNTL